MKKTVVIGAGPAGMMAALAAAQKKQSVVLLEQNEKPGKKLFITGKGRCNITNAGDMDALLEHVVTNRKFLYSAFYAFDNFRVIDFFETHGVKTKTERGNRVFPFSDHSSDVISALQRALKQAGVRMRLKTKVRKLCVEEGKVCGVLLETGETLFADAVIVATGGCSYPQTGSSGDGYRMAEACGHTIVQTEPALVPLTAKEAYVKALQGLSLKNVKATIRHDARILFEEFGEMLFTHFGVSGPLMLSASSIVGQKLQKQPLALTIDLKPALTEKQLDLRILRDFEQNQNRQFQNAIQGLLPAKLRPVIVELSQIPPDRRVHAITKEERGRLIALLKAFPLTLEGTRGFEEAIVTRGGISTKDVNPSTMESRRIKGLFFAGEALDVDALTGGYNLQIAWSTGYLAGSSIE